MSRAAIYVRVSTKKVTQKDSPEHQRALCQSFCDEHGLEVVKVYEDRDSGTSIVGRPDVQRMIKDAQNGEFDSVVFASLSRFSRDTLDSIGLKRMLVNALRKRVVSIEDMYDSQEKDDETIFNIIASVNQKLSEQISVASKRGIQQSALKGNFTGTYAPYGYKKAVIGGRKTLVIDDEAAHVVRLIFDLYVNQKMGDKKIVDYLNTELDIPSPRKRGAWGITTIQRILQNEAYTGRNVFSKYKNVTEYNDLTNMYDRRKKLVQRDKKKWKRTENKTHEPIIDDDLFQKAQEIRLYRGGGSRGGNKKPVNVFRKMIYCKHCGSAMVVMSSKVSKSNKLYRYMICSRRRRAGVKGCENGKWIPYQEMRDELIGWVERRIREWLDVEAGTEGVINHLKEHESPAKSLENEIKKIQKQIEKNREMMFKLRKQNMEGEVDDSQFKFEMEMFKKEITDLEEKLEKMQEVVAHQKDYNEERAKIMAAVNELTNLDTYEEVEKVRITLSKLITEIIVDNDGNIDVYTLLGKLA